MKNLELWNSLKTVPESAQKTIPAGRLKGFTEINPIWRLHALTEHFGPVGVGWSYKIDRTWIEEGSEDQRLAFVQVSVRYKLDGEWSEYVPGLGGSMLVAQEGQGERRHPYSSDECYKMALTDAISTALKALGVGADIYAGGNDFSKYSGAAEDKVKAQYQHLIGSKDGLGLYCMMMTLDQDTKVDLHNSWGPGKISQYKKISSDLEAQGFELLSNIRNGIDEDDALKVVENLEGITLDGKRYLAKLMEDDQMEYIRQAVRAAES